MNSQSNTTNTTVDSPTDESSVDSNASSEKSVGQIQKDSQKKGFCIPSYQRGYRWQKVNVTDLLNDLDEFLQGDKSTYSLQPLVVASPKNEKNTEKRWNVVDGQQRLTSLAILFGVLGLNGETGIKISWESRSDLQLESVETNLNVDNIDKYHVIQARKAIKEWFAKFEDKKEDKEDTFRKLLTDQHPDGKRVSFIWFVTKDDEVRTFIRLNKDKISLTNAELVKALLLKRGNFSGDSQMAQKSIGAEWDAIERTLCNESFWGFLNPIDYRPDTRIDFLLDTIRNKKYFENSYEFSPQQDLIGDDKYASFRYYYEFFKKFKEDAFGHIWSELQRLFNTFTTWYNDSELFHYVGYLVVYNTTVSDLLDDWEKCNTKQEFVELLKKRIQSKISGCKDLNKCYKTNGSDYKGNTRPLLLLFNVEQTVIQNRILADGEKMGLLTWFPFHLFKQEDWDVEHIAAATDNPLDKEKDQEEWLKTFLLDENLSSEIRQAIVLFILGKSGIGFEELKEHLGSELNKTKEGELLKSEEDKNKIWNYCLLDASTNRGYGNSIFPVKRRVVISKSLGQQFKIVKRKVTVESELLVERYFEIIQEPTSVAYVPIGTDCVFKKAYTTMSTSARYWTRQDAEEYKRKIYEVLKSFGVTK